MTFKKSFLKIILFIYFTSFLSSHYVSAIQIESVHVKSKYSGTYLLNEPTENYNVRSDGISKIFSTNPQFEGSAKESDSFENKLSLDLLYKFNKDFTADLGIDAFLGYADTYWQPINNSHRLYEKDKHFVLRKADIKYKSPTRCLNYYAIRYYRGVWHDDWVDEGDLFGLYRKEYNPQKSINISGEIIPEALETKVQFFRNDLNIIFGQPSWGYKDSLYLKYRYRIFEPNYETPYVDTCLTFRRERVPWDKDEDRYSVAFTGKFYKFGLDFVDFGVLCQPYRVDEKYTYLKKTPSRIALDDQYNINIDHTLRKSSTDFVDSLGYKLQVEKTYSDVIRLRLTLAYLGLLAGNKMEGNAYIEHVNKGFLTITGKFSLREPLVGPNKYLYEGTKTNPGPMLPLDFQTRDLGTSPFVVDETNRKATLFDLYLLYDPTPTSCFYKYEKNNLDLWNINHEEDARLSAALGYHVSYYPTNTDRIWYYDENNEFKYTPYESNGMLAVEKPLHLVDFACNYRFNRNFRFIVHLKAGDKLADSGVSYLNQSDKAISSAVNMFSSDLIVDYKSWMLAGAYRTNILGPEDWHRMFGLVINKMYKVSLSKEFNRSIDIGIDYLSVVRNKTNYESDLGSFDEIRVSLNWKFERLLRFK